MAEENKEVVKREEQVEVSDRGLFNFMGKKKDEEEALATGVQNVHIDDEPEQTEEKEGHLHKLHRSHSSSSSSSDEEEEGPDGEKKKKKKKGVREKIKEKLHGGDHDATVTEQDVLLSPAPPAAVTEQDVLLSLSPAPPASVTQQDVLLSPAPPQEDTSVVVEKVEAEEKKGFLDKIKEKLPGHGHKKEAGEESTEPAKESAAAVPQPHEGGETAEKKGFLGKIMEKLPGYHKEEIDKNTPPAGH